MVKGFLLFCFIVLLLRVVICVGSGGLKFVGVGGWWDMLGCLDGGIDI